MYKTLISSGVTWEPAAFYNELVVSTYILNDREKHLHVQLNTGYPVTDSPPLVLKPSCPTT